jgi:hypothetical protein
MLTRKSSTGYPVERADAMPDGQRAIRLGSIPRIAVVVAAKTCCACLNEGLQLLERRTPYLFAPFERPPRFRASERGTPSVACARPGAVRNSCCIAGGIAHVAVRGGPDAVTAVSD